MKINLISSSASAFIIITLAGLLQIQDFNFPVSSSERFQGNYSEILSGSINRDTIETENSYKIVLEGEGDFTKELQDQLDAIPNGTSEHPVNIILPEGRF